MANIQSAKKRNRRNERARVVNKTRLGRIRTFIKKVESALEANDAATADDNFKTLQPELQRGAAKGVIGKKTASRKLSRLSARIVALKKSGAKPVVADEKKSEPKKSAAKKAPAKKESTTKAEPKKAPAKKPAAKKTTAKKESK